MRRRPMELVSDASIKRIESRPSLGDYTRALWGKRYFIRADAAGKSMTKGRDTFLGRAWVILDPLVQVLLYAFIFGVVLGIDRGMENFVGFLTIGVIYFRLCTRGFATGVNLIQKSKAMISSFQFPRAAMPLGVSLKEAIDSVAPGIVAIVVALALQPDKTVSWTIILVLPVLVLIGLFGLGLCFIVARLTAFIPDLKTPVSLISRGLFFLSGVFFSLERFDAHPTLSALMKANPVYQFLTAVRTCVLDGTVPELGVWLYLSLWSFGLAIIGYVFFWEAESRYSGVR